MTKEKLGELILASERQMYATARSILQNDVDCADAIQETIVKAFSNIAQLRRDRYAKTWLMRILINECHNLLRKNSKILPIGEWDRTGKMEVPEKKDYSELYKAVQHLTEELRVTVTLYYMEEFSVKEIAAIMEVSEGAVQKRLARARKQIKRELQELEVDKQVKQEKTVKMRSIKRKHWSFGKTAAVAACAALAVSTIVYAGTSLYRIYTEKKGNYGVITIIEEEADQSITLPEQIPKLKLQPNYIPERMEWKDDESKCCLDYTDGQGGFSFSVLLLDQPYNDAQMVDTNVVETETRSFGRYEGTYLRMNDLGTTGNIGYNQTFYLLCPEEYQILIANVSSNVSKEEAYQVMENLELTETGEMMETADVYGRWSN